VAGVACAIASVVDAANAAATSVARSFFMVAGPVVVGVETRALPRRRH
jgi:hypothetical protein